MLIDYYLPVYDISDSVAVVANADLDSAWEALMNVDLIEVGRKRPIVGVLGALRVLPDLVSQLVHGGLPHRGPQSLKLGDLTALPAGAGGWVLLGRRDGDEIALGLIGKFWRPVIEFAQISTPAEFLEFSEPGYAKTIYSLSLHAVGTDRTLISGAMRTATTDDHARQWFRRYWTFGVGSGAHVLVNGLLEVTREMAEQKATLPATG